MKIVARSKFMAVLHQLGRLLPKDNGIDRGSGFWDSGCIFVLASLKFGFGLT